MIDQFILHNVEQVIDLIIHTHNISRKFQILIDVGVKAPSNHPNRVFPHQRKVYQILKIRFAGNIDHKAGNIRRLIADAFHIRYHFKRCGDQAQVFCHGLLL